MILARVDAPQRVLSHSAHSFWTSIGGRILTLAKPGQAREHDIEDIGGWYGRFLDEFGCELLIKRPDYYVFGMCPSVTDLPALIDDFRHQLGDRPG
jgi:hypothetical protein